MKRFSDGRSRTRSILGLVAVLALLLVACQADPGLSAEDLQAAYEAEIDATGFDHDDSRRVRFLPPIGNNRPHHGDYVGGLDLEIRFFNVTSSGHAFGNDLGPVLSTENDEVDTKGLVYSAKWKVHETTRNRRADSLIRIEIRLPGAGDESVCNGDSSACLGYVDVRLVKSGHHGRFDWQAEEVSRGWERGQGRHHTPHGFIVVSSKGQLKINFKVLAVEGEEPPESISELQTLAGAQPFDETAGNCAASEFDRPGQGLQAVGAGLQAVGAVGGLFSGASSDFAGEITTTEAVAEQIRNGLLSDYFKRDVAILVVDDFGGEFKLPRELFAGGSPDLEALVASGALSHGALVFHQLLELADEALPHFRSYVGHNPRIDSDPYVKFHDYRGNYLMIQAVDVAGLDTDLVAERIRDAIGFIGGNGGIGYKHVVVNMSFAIVPCAVVDDFGAVRASTNEIATFEAYVAALGAANGIGEQYNAELGQLVGTPVDLSSEPLFTYLNCPLPSASGLRCDGKPDGEYSRPTLDSLVHVAASGNFGNDYALYPAAWPSVVSVGSLTVEGEGYAQGPSSFSNAATVLAPGQSFELNSRRGRTVAYAGTSFSAPVVSLFAALDQMVKQPQCDHGSLSGAVATGHALASSDLDGLPLLAAFAGGRDDAVSLLCSN